MMTRIYGHRWTSAFGDVVDPGNVWTAVLRGLTEQHIRLGLSRLVEAGHEWPPTAVQFRTICEARSSNSVPGYGTALTAFLRIISKGDADRDWSSHHPVLYWIYREIGSFDCQLLQQEAMIRRFRDLWPTAEKLAQSGQLHPAPLKRLPDPNNMPITEKDRQCGNEVLEKLKAQLRASP